MELLAKLRKLSKWLQLVICFMVIAVTAVCCHFLLHLVDYQAVAFIMLFALSLIAAIFDRWPILAATVFAAMSWNYFFIPPRFDFHIASDTDLLIFLTFFMIAFFNLILSARIRELDRKKREELDHERTVKLYNTILQTLSHELRTPIAGILGSLDTLNELRERLNPEQVSELTSNMQLSALRLNDQVDKLLSMSRLEAGALKVHKDWVDVEDFVSSFISRNRALWRESSIAYNVGDDLPLCRIDASLVEPVLFNLVQNAYIYSGRGKLIGVSAAVTGGSLIFTVSDNGPGIPEHALQQLFDKFYRLPDAAAGGTGLGLSIVKGFTEVHGGTVRAANGASGGAVFTVSIPCELSWIKSLKHD